MRINFSAEASGYPDPSFPLNIVPTSLDFTEVEGKKRTKMSAMIQNVSGNRLKIKPVGYPEDLFKVRLADSDLKPGEKTKLMVKVNRRANLGKFDKTITFELNDKDNTRFSIPLTRTAIQHKPVEESAAGKTEGK